MLRGLAPRKGDIVDTGTAVFRKGVSRRRSNIAGLSLDLIARGPGYPKCISSGNLCQIRRVGLLSPSRVQDLDHIGAVVFLAGYEPAPCAAIVTGPHFGKNRAHQLGSR